MPPTISTTNTENTLNTVPIKRVLIAGIILGILHPPIVGLVYALCFVFTKATRRVALYVAVWAIVWTVAISLMLGFLPARTPTPKVFSPIQKAGTTDTTIPAGLLLPKATTTRTVK